MDGLIWNWYRTWKKLTCLGGRIEFILHETCDRQYMLNPGWNKMAIILQTIISDVCWRKVTVFWFRFHRGVLAWALNMTSLVQAMDCLFGDKPLHEQLWTNSFTHIYIYSSSGPSVICNANLYTRFVSISYSLHYIRANMYQCSM